AEPIVVPDEPMVAKTLQDPAADLRWQRLLAAQRGCAERQRLPRAQGGLLLRRKAEVYLERAPAVSGELLEQRLFVGSRRPGPRQRLVRREFQEGPIPVDLRLQREQRRVPVAVPQLLFQEL